MPLSYDGKTLTLSPRFEKDVVAVLRIIAKSYERDVRKLNTKSFKRYKMVKENGNHLPQSNIDAVFSWLAEKGFCTFKRGESGIKEKVEFIDMPAPIVARRLLGLPDDSESPRRFDLDVEVKHRELAKNVLFNDKLDADSKVEMLKMLYSKEG